MADRWGLLRITDLDSAICGNTFSPRAHALKCVVAFGACVCVCVHERVKAIVFDSCSVAISLNAYRSQWPVCVRQWKME